MKPFAICLALLSAACLARATEWDHYQVILEKHPFGALTALNTNITPDFAKSMRLCSIWMAHGQPRAGFEDASEKIKRDYVLGRGEVSEDGIELVDVNVGDESAIIRKGTETATLHIQSGSSTNLPVVGAPGMPPGAGSSGNPWRDFYERYRQRHQQDGGAAGGPPPFPMPNGAQGGPFTMGGPGGAGAFTVSGGAGGQPVIIQMQAASMDAAAAKASKKYNAQADMSGGTDTSGATGIPRSKKHNHPSK